jgi:hydrogenase maturation protease
MNKKRILILGVGNVLMSDEGAGIYTIRKLEERYRFSDNVTLLDGGTLGMKLLHSISRADHLIVADTAIRGLTPGTVSRLTLNDIRLSASPKSSMHQLSFADVLALAEMMQILPETVIISIEPADIKSMNTICTTEVYAGINIMCSFILSEVTAAGGKYWRNTVDNE